MTIQVTVNFIGGTSAEFRMERDPKELLDDFESALKRNQFLRHAEDGVVKVLNPANITVITIRNVT